MSGEFEYAAEARIFDLRQDLTDANKQIADLARKMKHADIRWTAAQQTNERLEERVKELEAELQKYWDAEGDECSRCDGSGDGL